MPDFREVLRQKKASVLAAAEKAAREIDADLAKMDAYMKEIERLSAKHGLEPAITTEKGLLVPAEEKGLPISSASASASAKLQRNPDSPYSRAKIEGEQIIREVGRPLPFRELYQRLAERGIVFTTKDPKAALSAYLGARTNMYSIRGIGWWIKGEPLPPDIEGRLLLKTDQAP